MIHPPIQIGKPHQALKKARPQPSNKNTLLNLTKIVYWKLNQALTKVAITKKSCQALRKSIQTLKFALHQRKHRILGILPPSSVYLLGRSSEPLYPTAIDYHPPNLLTPSYRKIPQTGESKILQSPDRIPRRLQHAQRRLITPPRSVGLYSRKALQHLEKCLKEEDNQRRSNAPQLQR